MIFVKNFVREAVFKKPLCNIYIKRKYKTSISIKISINAYEWVGVGVILVNKKVHDGLNFWMTVIQAMVTAG